MKLNVGYEALNLYNTITGTFIDHDVRDTVGVSVPAHSAMVLVYTPAKGRVSYRSHQTLVNGRVIDYLHGQGTGP